MDVVQKCVSYAFYKPCNPSKQETCLSEHKTLSCRYNKRQLTLCYVSSYHSGDYGK
jgi:hypothetical protein